MTIAPACSTEDATQGNPKNGYPAVPKGSGQASLATSSLTEGQHIITADYSGVAGQFNMSLGTVLQTVDGVTLVNGTTFCNTGKNRSSPG